MGFIRKHVIWMIALVIAGIAIALCIFMYITTSKLDKLLQIPESPRRIFVIESQKVFLKRFKQAIGLTDQANDIQKAEKRVPEKSPAISLPQEKISAHQAFQLGKKLIEQGSSKSEQKRGLGLLMDSAEGHSLAGAYYLSAYCLEKHVKTVPQNLLQQAAAENGPIPQIFLSLLYGEGEVFPKNISQSIYWAEKASQSGNPDAMYVRAMMLSQWDGYPHAPQRAVELFRRAAELGHPKAQFMLGEMYFSGELVEKDLDEALKWTALAAKQSLAEAEYAIGRMAKTGIAMKADVDWANVWFDRAAHHGLPEAQYDMAINYIDANPISRDVTAGAVWFYYAAENGYIDAQVKLGYMYSKGLGIKADKEQAIYWLGMASKAGNQQAAILLNDVKRQPFD